jgi:hypothetical protein
MHNFQNREILVFLALAEMAGFQSRPPSYTHVKLWGKRSTSYMPSSGSQSITQLARGVTTKQIYVKSSSCIG